MTVEKYHSPHKRRGPKERQAEGLEVLRLKVLGMRDAAIAEQLGMSIFTVNKRKSEALALHGSSTVAEYREETKQQLEMLLAACVPGIADSDMLAVANATRILAQKAKLLGLDAPVQVDMHVTEHTEQDRTLAAMLAAARAETEAREETIIEGEVA